MMSGDNGEHQNTFPVSQPDEHSQPPFFPFPETSKKTNDDTTTHVLPFGDNTRPLKRSVDALEVDQLRQELADMRAALQETVKALDESRKLQAMQQETTQLVSSSDNEVLTNQPRSVHINPLHSPSSYHRTHNHLEDRPTPQPHVERQTVALLKPRRLVDLPEFRGGFEQWSIFSLAYERTTSLYSYTNDENHIPLTKSLLPPALNEVSGLMLHPDNVSLVMKHLKDIYGRAEIVARAIIGKVLKTPQISAHKEITELVAFSRDVTNMVGHVRATAAAARLGDHMLLDQLVAKLTPARREKWLVYFHEELFGIGDVNNFATWLHNQAQYQRMLQDYQSAPNPFPFAPRPTEPPRARGVYSTEVDDVVAPVRDTQMRQCVCCGEDSHRVSTCPMFADQTPHQRWMKAQADRWCFACLTPGHTTRMCRRARQCGREGCRRRHHPLLHDSENTQETHEVNAVVSESGCIFKYIPVTVSGPKGKISVIAFIDDGSKASLIDESLARELGLRGPTREIDFKWIDGRKQRCQAKVVEIGINQFTAKNVLTVPELDITSQAVDFDAIRQAYPQTRDIPLAPYKNERPRILLGVNQNWLISPTRILKLDADYTAIETKIGWTVYGGTETPNQPTLGHVDMVSESQDDSLYQIEKKVEKFSELNRLVFPASQDALMNPEEQHALHLLHQTTKLVGDRYETGLLWIKDVPKLPSSYGLAREGKFGVCGDVKEMFHRVHIRKEDQNALRFLWRASPEENPQHAEQFKTELPRAVKAIVDYHYVDDYVDSFDTEEEAEQVVAQVIRIEAAAGFELRGIISNSKKVLNQLEEDGVLAEMDRNGDDDKVLGLWWNRTDDQFTFRLNQERLKRVEETLPTKRDVMSLIMSVYDPLSFLANVTIRSHRIMQKIWASKIDWKEKITDEIHAELVKWIAELRSATKFRISRWHHMPKGQDTAIQLHIFVDASEVAYSAVGYWRITTGGKTHASFIVGKCRVVPFLAPTIPRLELQAAVLGTHLRRTIIEAHEITAEQVIMWTDSKTVFQWISNRHTHGKLDAYHRNRLFTILEGGCAEEWRWVPGRESPADVATRPGAIDDTWIAGADFLRQPPETWPQLTLNTGEEVGVVQAVSIEEPIFDVKKWSWVGRACKVFRQQLNRGVKTRNERVAAKTMRDRPLQDRIKAIPPMTAQDFQVGERLMIIDDQKVTFGGNDSKDLLKIGRTVVDGIIRVDGRLRRANWMTFDSRYPVILSKDSPLAQAIVRHMHERFYHQNASAVNAAVRARFWIIKGKRVLQKVKTTCQWCKNHRAKPSQPIMSELPVERLQPYVRPFTYVGLDYAGPFTVAIGRRVEKRWVALFTCLTIRAAHLEVARDLSTEAALMCLTNLINRRGLPCQIRSDQGTNFIGAAGLLEKACAEKEIVWIKNTPKDAAAGGVWERLIQVMKKILQESIGEQRPQLDTFTTALIEAENLINSRPLIDVPIGAEEDDPITPNHFLMGGQSFSSTPSVLDQISIRGQWNLRKEMMDAFWAKWTNQYLPTLIQREKWNQPTRELKPDDIVVFGDASLGKGQWHKGRVIEIIRSKDGCVRSAKIHTAMGILHRPAAKLAVLDVGGGQDVVKRQ